MIEYKRRNLYKYTLAADYHQPTALRPAAAILTKFITLDTTGVLTITKGYAWDGPSGPSIDTKTFMRGSMVHDALYQLIRDGWLTSHDRQYADQLLKQICLEAGMSRVRAWWVNKAVRLGGRSSVVDVFQAP